MQYCYRIKVKVKKTKNVCYIKKNKSMYKIIKMWKNMKEWIGCDKLERLHRKERVAAILKILSDNPNKIYSLGYFSEKFDVARSTLSEDVVIMKKLVEEIKCGTVETISGAAGGVKFIPGMADEDEIKFIEGLCKMLQSPDRIIPGGFIYMNDIIYSPDIVSKMGIIFAQRFQNKKPDYVVTVETKGIPIAIMTARALGIPLIIVRTDSRVTEGSTVSINYVTGSSKRIRTMSLSKRSVKPESKYIFIDDFMKAGGTSYGIYELMKEFSCECVGIGVAVESYTESKKVKEYFALMELKSVDEEKQEILIYPSKYYTEKLHH